MVTGYMLKMESLLIWVLKMEPLLTGYIAMLKMESLLTGYIAMLKMEPLLDAESLPTGYMLKMDVRMYVRTHSQISVYVH